MTAISVEKVGLVAHYSEQGDWAFEAAFEFARERNLQLNIFYFLESSFDMPQNIAPKDLDMPVVSDETMIMEEKRLREYFDNRLGSYVNAGFKVCESVRHNFELRTCLMKQDFQILYIPYLYKGVPFGTMPIEEFATRFHAPVVLVGPDNIEQYYLNQPAQMEWQILNEIDNNWIALPDLDRLQKLSVL